MQSGNGLCSQMVP